MKINTIYLDTCENLLKDLPDESIDLVVTSPPYNIGKEYEKRSPLDIYLKNQQLVIGECCRVLKKTGSIFWQVGSYSINGSLIPLDVKIFPILEKFGMIPKNRIVWVRPHGLHGRQKFSARYETILWFVKDENYKFYLDRIRVPQKYQNKKYHKGSKSGKLSCNPLGKNPGDIWAFRNVKHNHEEQTIHPCQFPEDMITRIVLSVTDVGDLVLDPYMGTGTVAVSAKNCNRNFIGSEIDSKYHDIIQRRLDGKPDKHNSFPNLKTLRNYIDKTGKDISKYRFELQKGNIATERSKSKIYPERHHLKSFTDRVMLEEEFFSNKILGNKVNIEEYSATKSNKHVYQTKLNI